MKKRGRRRKRGIKRKKKRRRRKKKNKMLCHIFYISTVACAACFPLGITTPFLGLF
jgi:hypothetical protein